MVYKYNFAEKSIVFELSESKKLLWLSMHESGVLLRSGHTIVITRTTGKYSRRVVFSSGRVHNFLCNLFCAMLLVIVVVVVVSRFVLGGFGLGPGTDISRTSPSGGLKFMLGVGMAEVRLGLIPNFALGSIADVSGPTSPGGDSLVLRVGNVNGWFDVGRVEVSDIGITSLS